MTGPQNSLNGNHKEMSCEEFHALMPDLISSGDDIHLHPHIQTCELCRALLADLETIRDAARELFPSVEPPDELWSQIDAKIRFDDPGKSKDGNPEKSKDGEKSPV